MAADPNLPLSTVLGRALRAARAAGNAEALVSFTLEIYGMRDNSWRDAVEAELRPHYGSREELGEVWSRAVERWMKLRTGEVEGKEVFFSMSVSEIEAQMTDVAQILEQPRLEDRAAAAGRVSLARNRQLLARIRLMIVDQLTRIEREVLVGGMVETAFDRYRERVDRFLADHAPTVLEQLAAAYRRRDESDSEALSHALMSCRRALKSLADEVYPARPDPVIGVDGVTRKVTDDKFINRLLQYVAGQGSRSTSAQLVRATVADLGARLDGLTALASKGVHAAVNEAEVDQCIVQTYFTIGDILSLRQ